VELRDLRYFAVVAEHQNVGRTAEALDLSPTALSKSLRRLERDVGAKLFNRAARGVELSAVGAALLSRIAPLQGMLIDVRRECADVARGYAGHVSVGANPSAADNFLADACLALSRGSPHLTFNVIVAPNAALEKAVRRGELDFYVSALETFSGDDLVREKLCDLQDVIVASAHHRLARRKHVTIKDLASERWASVASTSGPQWQPIVEAFARFGLRGPSLAISTNSQTLRLSAVAYSDYLTVITRQFLRQESRRYPIVELPIEEMNRFRSLFITYRRDAYLSPAAGRLAEILKSQAVDTSAEVR